MSDGAESKGEIALVVGASGTIGQEIARKLVARGLTVIGIARSADGMADLAAELGISFRPLAANMGDDAAIDQIADAIDAPVAMVVHAPGLPVAGGIRQADTAALVEACNIKIGGLVRLVRGAEPHFRAGSRIVAVGGHYGFEPTAYAATAGVANAALANLIRQMNWAYGPDGITAHLVAPGPVDSDRLRNVAAARAQKAGTDLEDELQVMRGDSAINAFTTTGQVAWAIANLLDPEADALAGSTLFLDSGRRKGIP